MYRTNTCGELGRNNVGEVVTIAGWVDSARDHSGVFFVNLRDRYGKTQTVFDAAADHDLFQLVKTLHNEDVVQITGEVLARPEGLVNPEMKTGEIEIRATKLVVLNRSEPVPFLPSAPEVPSEEMRLKHRYIDLRRPEMQRVLTASRRRCATISTKTASSKLKRRSSVKAPPKARATTSSPAASLKARSTPSRSLRSSISSSL